MIKKLWQKKQEVKKKSQGPVKWKNGYPVKWEGGQKCPVILAKLEHYR